MEEECAIEMNVASAKQTLLISNKGLTLVYFKLMKIKVKVQGF